MPTHRTVLGFSCITTLACAASPPASAQPRTAPQAAERARPLVAAELKDEAAVATALRESYTKYEYRIPMRDGVRLYTVAYVPKDASRTWPILLMRTPYGVGPYGVDNYPSGNHGHFVHRFAPSPAFIRQGYVLVHQDVRGRLMSEGDFVDVRPHATQKGGIDESTDAWDTVDFLVKNVPSNNGRVGVWGISYPGFYAAQAAVNAHPAVKAVSPQAPVTEWFLGDDIHHNGALFLASTFDFYTSFGKPRPKPTRKMDWTSLHETGDAYDFFLDLGPIANANARFFEGKVSFWNQLVEHGTRDAFWKARDPRPFYRDVKPAVLTVGGWFDAEDLFGALETYRAFERQSPRAENTLVMGPWSHGGWARGDGDHLGAIAFGSSTATWFRDRVELPFFERHLRGERAPTQAEAVVFETGTNTWRQYPSWPPPGAQRATLYFHAKGELGAAAPGASDDASGVDAYVSDPAKPVPYRDHLSNDIDEGYMIDDQRFAARRPDVMTYTTGPLDTDVTLAGPLEATIWASTTGTDADFVIKLVDVYPDDDPNPDPNPQGATLGGYEQLVRAEVMRGKFRRSLEAPEPFKPGEPTSVRIALPDVNHTFRTGHRIMVQVQSSWFPLVDRNPQTFVDIYRATEADFKAATHRIYRTRERASGLTVTIARGALPGAPKGKPAPR